MRDEGTISSITRVNYRSRCGELLTRVLVIVQSKKLQTVQLIIHENTITMGRRWGITSALHVILDSGGFGCHGHRVWLSLEISRHKKILNCVSCLVFVLFACRGRWDFQCRRDDGIKFNLDSTFNFNSVGSLSKSRKNGAGNATEDSRATSHNCVKHFLVAIYKTSDRI